MTSLSFPGARRSMFSTGWCSNVYWKTGCMLRWKKNHFHTTPLDFLGFIIEHGQWRMEPSKVQVFSGVCQFLQTFHSCLQLCGCPSLPAHLHQAPFSVVTLSRRDPAEDNILHCSSSLPMNQASSLWWRWMPPTLELEQCHHSVCW